MKPLEHQKKWMNLSFGELGKRFLKADKSPKGNKNDATRVLGSWIGSLFDSWSKMRFEIVEDRKGEQTLIPLIERLVQANSCVATDEWKGYSSLTRCGYCHYTVNHSKSFVDPTTKIHTQLIERAWVEAKE